MHMLTWGQQHLLLAPDSLCLPLRRAVSLSSMARASWLSSSAETCL